MKRTVKQQRSIIRRFSKRNRKPKTLIKYSQELINHLKIFSKDLANIPYEHIYDTIACLSNKFVPIAKLNKGWFIDRVRINYNGEIFTGIDDVGYNKKNLDKIKYGRANIPHQAVFYGSVVSFQLDKPYVVAHIETSEKLRHSTEYDEINETFTVSRWKILEDIGVVEMIFSKEALQVNADTMESYMFQSDKIKNHKLKKYFKKTSMLFSEEFAKKDIGVGEEYKYKISSAYANYIWNKTELIGITYPSVASGYVGQNIALLPEAVDKYLQLECVAMYKFERNNGKNLIYPIRYATNLGKKMQDFQWIDIPESDFKLKNKTI